MDFGVYIRMIWRGAWIVVLTAVLAASVAWYAASLQPPLYRSSAQLIVSPDPSLQPGDIIYAIDTLDRRSVVTTYSQVLGSRRIFDEAASSLNLSPAVKLQYTHSAVVLPDAHVLELAVTGPDAQTVARLTNEMGQRTIAYVTEVYNGTYDVGMLEEAIVPLEQLSPQPLRDGVLALALGVLFGSLLAIAREHLRPRSRSQHTTEETSNSALFASSGDFQRRLENELASSTGNVLSVALVSLGIRHGTGRAVAERIERDVIPQVHQILRNELRGKDYVGRWTPTSFAICFPELTGHDAAEILNRINLELSKPVVLEQGVYSISPSSGLATYSGTESAAILIARAQAALEQSEASHRNVVSFPKDAPLALSHVAHDQP